MFSLAVLAFLGTANLAYVVLSRRLLVGLRNLARPRESNPEISPERPPVTVLIAARNEEERIAPCLEALFAQDYPRDRLQIIVVDDRSEDRTAEILADFQGKQGDLLSVVRVQATPFGLSPKKHALAQGMKEARGEIILTTDADCLMGPRWISTLVEHFAENTGLVLGMTSYYRLPLPGGAGRPLRFWGTQALEFISYGIVAAALVGLRFPVHGNANNIAYRRRVYDLASGFDGHGRIVSGDDDFLIQSIHALGRWDIRYAVHPDSQVQTEPPLSLRQFWEQRKRWASKCGFYKPKQAAFLAAIFLYYVTILSCLVLGSVFRSPGLFLAGLGSWGIKTGMDWLVMRSGLSLFGRRELLRHFPSAAVLHIPLIIAAVAAGSVMGFTWKGQLHRRRK
jgi:cellulose synthase/poly-beta-1,6-N-acetylglucosamine synthase-like glycosyltransferase